MSAIETLQSVLQDRLANPKEGSYTNLLLSDEEELVKKVGEESVEVILAALKQGNDRIVSETADLLYHVLVLLVSKGISWSEIEAELASRAK